VIHWEKVEIVDENELIELELKFIKKEKQFQTKGDKKEIIKDFSNSTFVLKDENVLTTIMKNNITIEYFEVKKQSKMSLDYFDLEYFVNRVALPLAALLNGRIVLHGNACSWNDEGIIVLGKSGVGKSTVTTTLALTNDENVICDDTVVIDQKHNKVFYSSSTSRLFEENLDIIKNYSSNGKSFNLDTSFDKKIISINNKEIFSSYSIKKIFNFSFSNAPRGCVKRIELSDFIENTKFLDYIPPLILNEYITKIFFLIKNTENEKYIRNLDEDFSTFIKNVNSTFNSAMLNGGT